MRKKATYWGVALSLALGVTAVAAYTPAWNMFSAGVSALADGDDAEEPVSLGAAKSISPASGSTVSTAAGLEQIKIVFQGDVTLDRTATGVITVKNEGGQVLQTIPMSSTAAVVPGTNYVTINLPEPIAENGEYTVTFPAGVLTVAVGEETVPNEAVTMTYAGDYAEPTSVVPANGSKVIQDSGLTNVTISFSKAVTIDRYVSSGGDDSKNTIFVMQGDEILQRIPLSSTSGFGYADGAADNVVKITFPEALTTPGEYDIVVPRGAVYVANITDTGTSAGQVNAQIKLHYTIEKPFHYSVFPAQGSQLTELKDFQVVFSDATAIKLTSDYDLQDQAVLQYYAAGVVKDVSLFNLSTTGANTLKLEAIDPYNTPITAVATQWNQIYLPAGLLTLTIDGVEQPSPEMTLSKYQVLAFPASDFSSPVIGVTAGVPAEDFKEFNLHVDGTDVAFAGTAFTYIYLYPVVNGVVTTTAHANFSMAAADGAGNFKLTMRAPTSATAVLGNPQLWESGQYIIRMPANAVSKNINGTTYKNLAVDLGPIYINGISSAVPSSVTPANGTVINTNSGLSNVQMIFGTAMEGVAGKNISIYREGEEKPLSTVAANGSTVVFSNSNKTIDFSFPVVNTPGTYRVVVPAGAFHQTAGNGLINDEMTLTYVLPEVTPMVASPSDYSVCTTDEQLNTVVLTYPEVESIEFANPDVPVVLPLYNNVSTTIKTNYTASIEGNQVILKAPEGFKHAVSANDLFFLIPGGLWNMKGKDGKTYQNLPETLVYKFAQMPRPAMSWQDLPEITLGNVKDGFTVKAPEGYIVANVNETATYCPKLYMNTYVPGGTTLSTAATNTYAQFFPIMAADSLSVKFVPITEAFKAEVAANEDGKYTAAQQTAVAKFTTLYNTDGIVSGNYYLRLAGSATYTNCSVAFGTEEYVQEDVKDPVTGEVTGQKTKRVVTPVPCTAPWNYTFDIEGLSAYPVELDLKDSYESLPDQIVISSEAGALGFFPALKTTFYIRPKVGASWSTARALTAEVVDGKLVLTVPATVKTALATTYSEMCITTSTANSIIGTGTIAISTGETLATNESGTYTFKVTGPITNPEHTVAPVVGSLPVGDELSEITITYPEDFAVELNPANNTKIYVTKEGEAAPVAALDPENVTIEGNVVTISFPEPIKAEGTYTVTLNRGMFLYGELKANSVEYNLTYKVSPLAAAAATVTPTTGTTIDYFTGVTFEFTTLADIAKAETVGDITFSFVNPLDPNAEPMSYPLYAYANPDGASVIVTVDEKTEAELKSKGQWPINMPGTYTVTIPQNAFVVTTDDGTQYGVTARNLTYELTPNVTASWEPKNGTIITELKTITATIKDFSFIEKTPAFQCNVSGAGQSLANTVDIVDGKIVVTLDEAQSAQGTYSVSIPAKSLAISKTADGVKQYAPALSYSLSISGAPTLTCVTPTDGSVIEWFSNITLVANYTPSANRACTEPIVVKRNGEVVYSVSNRSSSVTYEFMGALGNIDISFTGSNKDYTPGTYTVEIPEGAFLLGGEALSPAKTFTFIVPESAQFVVTPTINTRVESLGDIEVYFPGGSDIVLNSAAGVNHPYLDDHFIELGSINGYSSYVPAPSESNQAVIDKMVEIKGDRVILHFTETKTPGEYIFQLPAGAFTLQQNGQTVKNVLVQYHYYISQINSPTVEPEPGVIAPDGLNGDMIITLAGEDVFSQMNNGTTYNLYRLGEDGIWDKSLPVVASWYYDYAAEGSADGKHSITMKANQQNLVLEEGNYVFRIKERTLFVKTDEYIIEGGEDASDTSDIIVCTSPFFFYYTVVNKPEVDFTYTLTPENGQTVSALDNVTVKFDKAEEVVLNGPAATLACGNEIVILIGETNGNTVTLTTSEKMADGEWTLTIPEAAYLVDGEESPAIEAVFTLVAEQSAIAALFGEGTPLNVFTTNGICVLRNATAEQVADLEAGLYIINGKKVYLRK